MVKPIDKDPISLYTEEVAAHGGFEVFHEFDDNIALIVGDPREFLGHATIQSPMISKNWIANVLVICNIHYSLPKS